MILTDGTEVASDSYEWRLECLARYVARMPADQCNEWMSDHEKRNGKATELWARIRLIRESTDTTTGGKA